MKKITKKMIANGFDTGKVMLTIDPNTGSGTVCRIGKDWFYFGGLTAEELNPSEYFIQVGFWDTIREILETLDEFAEDESFKDEYRYYYSCLS